MAKIRRDPTDLDLKWMGRRTRDMKHLRHRKDRSWWRSVLRGIGGQEWATTVAGGRFRWK